MENERDQFGMYVYQIGDYILPEPIWVNNKTELKELMESMGFDTSTIIIG